MIRLIAAIDSRNGIARRGAQPWLLPDDVAYFQRQTKRFGGTTLMGHTTYKIIGHPLRARRNLVASRRLVGEAGIEIIANLQQYLAQNQDDVWVIGGASIYAQAIEYSDELYLTRISADLNCDQYFPDYNTDFTRIHQSAHAHQNNFTFCFEVWQRKFSGVGYRA